MYNQSLWDLLSCCGPKTRPQPQLPEVLSSRLSGLHTIHLRSLLESCFPVDNVRESAERTQERVIKKMMKVVELEASQWTQTKQISTLHRTLSQTATWISNEHLWNYLMLKNKWPAIFLTSASQIKRQFRRCCSYWDSPFHTFDREKVLNCYWDH